MAQRSREDVLGVYRTKQGTYCLTVIVTIIQDYKNKMYKARRERCVCDAGIVTVTPHLSSQTSPTFLYKW